MPEGRAEKQQANDDGGKGRDEDCGGANVFADLCKGVMIWADEIHHGFDGGVEEFGSEHQRSSQDEAIDQL